MTEQEYIKKIDAGECFSESEIKSLVYDYDYEYKVVSGNLGRWTQSMTTIVKLCDRYFAIHWERGLTEMQEDDFWYSSIEEVEPKERVITVIDWFRTRDGVFMATSSELND